jgi:hypothetical protein
VKPKLYVQSTQSSIKLRAGIFELCSKIPYRFAKTGFLTFIKLKKELSVEKMTVKYISDFSVYPLQFCFGDNRDIGIANFQDCCLRLDRVE